MVIFQVRTRGLPDDHIGAVRIVTIDGLEVNMCCGTHVSNLSHLQVLVLYLRILELCIYLIVHGGTENSTICILDWDNESWGTNIGGLMRGMATLPQGNQEQLVA